jgi:hypothetical protein
MFKKENVTLRKYKPVFTTTDGKVIEGKTTKWLITNRIAGSVKEFLMLGVSDNGFISDDLGDIYILYNIIKVSWAVVDEKVVKDTFREYQFWVNEEEVCQD